MVEFEGSIPSPPSTRNTNPNKKPKRRTKDGKLYNEFSRVRSAIYRQCK